MLVTNLVLYLASFVAIWLGAGLIIKSIDRIAKKLNLSTFAISFFLLGILTSIPEMALSLNAIEEGKPEIFVGNLIGGVAVIFLFIIPVLAIFGKGLTVNHSLSKTNLMLTLAVSAAPAFFAIDRRITSLEGLILIILYFILFFLIQKKHGIFASGEAEVFSLKAYSFLDLIKVAAGVGLVFISGDFIVEQTILFSEILKVPPFYISLIVLSLGTNLPELSLAVRGILSGKQDIAFGDYLGSAAANALLFGIFTILSGSVVIVPNNFLILFIILTLGFSLFYYFSRSQRVITVKEGFILLGVYILFVAYEVGKEFLF